MLSIYFSPQTTISAPPPWYLSPGGPISFTLLLLLPVRLGMLLRVGLGLLLKLLGLLPQQLGNVGLEGMVRLGILHHGRQQLGAVANVQRRTPSVGDEVGADVAGVGLDVGMVNGSDELDLRRLERVRGWEDEGEGEGSPGVGG